MQERSATAMSRPAPRTSRPPCGKARSPAKA